MQFLSDFSIETRIFELSETSQNGTEWVERKGKKWRIPTSNPRCFFLKKGGQLSRTTSTSSFLVIYLFVDGITN